MVKKLNFKPFEIDYHDDKKPCLFFYYKMNGLRDGQYIIAEEGFESVYLADSLEEFARAYAIDYDLGQDFKILLGGEN